VAQRAQGVEQDLERGTAGFIRVLILLCVTSLARWLLSARDGMVACGGCSGARS
jgi:hypothetical protein